MPAYILEDPLGLRCTFSKGQVRELPVSMKPDCQGALARDLLAGLVSVVHPHGRVDSARVVRDYVRSIERMVRALDERAPRGAGDLSVGMLSEFWMGQDAVNERRTRAMLLGIDEERSVLRPEVRRLVGGRNFHPEPESEPRKPYLEHEWSELLAALQKIVDDSFARHQDALRELEAIDAASVRPGSPESVLAFLAQKGPRTVANVAEHFLVPPIRNSQAAELDVVRISHRLFPSQTTAYAYKSLFVALTGIVSDGVAGLGLGDIDWAGDSTVLLDYVKGRTSAESNNLPGAGVALLRQWLQHSELLRGFAGPKARAALWIRTGEWQPGRILSRRFGSAGGVGQSWQSRLNLPVAPDGPRMRTTFEALRDRSHWHGSGRATIDPNHTSRTEAERYVGTPTPQQRARLDSVIEDGQGDLLRKALKPLRVVTAQDAAEAARQLPAVVADLALDDTVIGELVGTERDVFAAACIDMFAGVFGPKGKACPARPWVCLACPLAVFAPRHASNLLRLQGFFAEQWQQMPSGEFMKHFGFYKSRVDEVIRKFEDGVIDQARARLAAEPGCFPLRPEERTA